MNRPEIPVYFCYNVEQDQERAQSVFAQSDSRNIDQPSIWSNEEWQRWSSESPDAVQHHMQQALEATRVTCLLIGERTVDTPWIRPMLVKSHEMGHGIFAVYIHNIEDYSGNLAKKGPNPLGSLKYEGKGGQSFPFASYYFTYDWVLHDGPNRFNKWVEIAYNQVTDGAWEL
jgi:hypothetical protein